MTVRTIDDIFRDFVTDGIPASGPFNPHKPDIRDTLKALLEGISTFPDNRVIRLNNADVGTENNIVVTASVAIPAAAYQVLYILNVTQENTGPVKVSGAINRDLVTNTSQQLASGYVIPGMAVLCIDTGDALRMLSYGDVESVIEDALARVEAARDAAELARDQAQNAASDAVSQGNVPIYTTRNAVEALEIPGGISALRTNGLGIVGDGGDALYSRVATEPNHAGWVRSADGGIFSITKRTVRASQFGAFPNVPNNSIPLNLALQYLDGVGGGCLEIDKDEEYLVAASVGLSAFNNHIRIENKAGGIIRAASGLSKAVLSFSGISSGVVPSTGALTLFDVRTNNQDGNTGVGVAGCTGLEVNYIDYLLGENFECNGGDFPINTRSDSGISTVGVRVAIINNPKIRGQGDAAIYPNWDNTGTIDGYFEVNGGHYSRNQNILTAKRNLKDVVWRGGVCVENRGGLTTQWVNNDGWIHPARSLDVSGVLFRKTLANVVQVKGNTRLNLENCRIIDIGYEFDGTGNVGASARAIAIQGAQRCRVKDIHFEMMDWASNLEYAFSLANDTTSGSTITTGNHDIEGLSYRNWYRTVIGGNVGDPSRWRGESYPSAALAVASDQHASSRMDYILTGDNRRYARIGTVSSNETFNNHIAPVSVSLTSLGTIAAGSQSSVQVSSVPGLLATDNVHVTRLTSTLANNPGLLVSVRPVADGVQYVIRNATATGINLSGESLRFSF